MDIQLLNNRDVDLNKWNAAISKSFNGIVYAYSWYLDIVSPDWKAFVSGDYDIVMPLTVNKRFGYEVFIQPILTQQLGVFSKVKLTPAIVEEFIQKSLQYYKYVNINLNKFNRIDNPEFRVEQKVTYELELIHSYERLYKKYSSNTKRNLKKAEKNNITIVKSVTPNQLIGLIRDNVGEKVKNLKEGHYNNIRKIIAFAIKHRLGEIFGAYSRTNELCAAAFILTSNNKAIYLFGASSKLGKDESAMFLIFDQFIKKNMERNLVLDFEGSNIPGLARFYKGFGANPFNYESLKINNLPWYVKLIKK